MARKYIKKHPGLEGVFFVHYCLYTEFYCRAHGGAKHSGLDVNAFGRGRFGFFYRFNKHRQIFQKLFFIIRNFAE